MTDVYASRAELQAVIGAGSSDAVNDRLDLALIAATRWVQYRVGTLETTDDDALEAPYTLTVVAATPGQKAACLAAATRFYKAPDAPFGVLGGGEYAVIVRTAIPEAELLLFGQREAFGFA